MVIKLLEPCINQGTKLLVDIVLFTVMHMQKKNHFNVLDEAVEMINLLSINLEYLSFDTLHDIMWIMHDFLYILMGK